MKYLFKETLSRAGCVCGAALISRWLLSAALILLSSCQNVSGPESVDDVTSLYERDVTGGIHDIIPVRGNSPKVLTITREGAEFKCTMCHSELIERRREKALQGEHKNIAFDHGRNLLCVNCHNLTDPDSFTSRDGGRIPANDSSALCGKCHVSHYEEWKLGVHGRINGYWNPNQGKQNRVNCIQCHDPHQPRFKKMTPESPPAMSRFDVKESEEVQHDEHE